MQDVIGHVERIRKGRFFICDAEQVLVRDNDQRIDKLLQFLDTGFGDFHAPVTFELEGFCYHADRQNALFAGGSGDNRCCAGACTAAHTGCDEHHMSTVQMMLDFIQRLFCRRGADFGP